MKITYKLNPNYLKYLKSIGYTESQFELDARKIKTNIKKLLNKHDKKIYR